MPQARSSTRVYVQPYTAVYTHVHECTRVYTQLPRPYLATAVGTNSRLNQSTGMPAGMATMTEFQLAAGYLFAGMEVI